MTGPADRRVCDAFPLLLHQLRQRLMHKLAPVIESSLQYLETASSANVALKRKIFAAHDIPTITNTLRKHPSLPRTILVEMSAAWNASDVAKLRSVIAGCLKKLAGPIGKPFPASDVAGIRLFARWFL
jgi:hypothetical protein